MSQAKKSQINVEPDPKSPPGTPRWVKVFGIIALALVLLFIVLQSIGGGNHGPGRHLPSSNAPPSSLTEDGVQQP